MHRYLTSKYVPSAVTASVWVGTFLIYYRTMTPSVGMIDSGELAAVACTLGIAHPTGYPLYTLLGRFFTMLPIADEVIVRLNVMSALFTSTAAALFFLWLKELFLSNGRNNEAADVIIAAGGAMMFAFSRTFWMQGVSAEVYSLHLLLVVSLLFAFVRALRTDDPRWWLLFAFVTGLAFTNHMTTILLAPGLLLWYFLEFTFSGSAVRRLLSLSLPFSLGLSVYLFLPVRAAQHPLLNWGNPQTWETFWWHVSGKQFRVWMFSSGEAAEKQFAYFWGNLTNEFHGAVLLLALIGTIGLLFSNRRLLIVLAVLFFTCIAYSINYDIHDIDSYFLLAYAVIAVTAAFGLRLLILRFEGIDLRIPAVVAAIGVAALQTYGHFDVVDQKGNYMVRDYAVGILTDLPPNAIVISSQWDFFVSPSYYFQHVEGLRPDVVVLDKELFRRSWYFPQLERMYPEVMQRSAQEVRAFLPELYKFEHDLPYMYEAIEGRFAALIRSFAVNNPGSPVFVTPEIEPAYFNGFTRVPEGVLFRLTTDTIYMPAVPPSVSIRDFPSQDAYTASLRGIIANAFGYRSAYERYYGQDSLALYYQKMARNYLRLPR